MYNDDREKKSKKISSISSTNDSLKNRSKVENYIRSLLLEQGYTEVRTPIINRYADIAPITQFKVQSPIEQAELYLRVAPTEQLKKLIYYQHLLLYVFIIILQEIVHLQKRILKLLIKWFM